MEQRCSFCNKLREDGDVMVQSPRDEDAIICVACIFWLKEVKDKAVLKEFNEKYRPSEEERAD
jgi:hypothetical protein